MTCPVNYPLAIGTAHHRFISLQIDKGLRGQVHVADPAGLRFSGQPGVGAVFGVAGVTAGLDPVAGAAARALHLGTLREEHGTFRGCEGHG